ncbi:hypothetical protein BGZ68_002408, partial [Mortierella alpina]
MVDSSQSISPTAIPNNIASSSLLPSDTPGAVKTDDDGSRMNTGAIIGGVLGCLALILLVACCFIFARRRRRRQEEEHGAGGIGGAGHSEYTSGHTSSGSIPPLAPVGPIGDLDQVIVEVHDLPPQGGPLSNERFIAAAG